ncbi:MAG TPA: PilZ domain-containing protein [Thermoanaerobaculia bacterium]|nr:PilZ domain-containing protein [Thermoanaerobaculia bacterium]
MVYSTPRKARRVPLSVRVHLKLEGVPDPITETLLNISLGGMAVGLRKSPPLGSLVAFEFDLADTLIEGTGEVVWSRPLEESLIGRSDVGVRFRYLSAGSRERIFRLVQWFATQPDTLTGVEIATALATGGVPALAPAPKPGALEKAPAPAVPVATTALQIPGTVTLPMPRPFEGPAAEPPSEPLFPRPPAERTPPEEPSWPVPDLSSAVAPSDREPRWQPFPAAAEEAGPTLDERIELDLGGHSFGYGAAVAGAPSADAASAAYGEPLAEPTGASEPLPRPAPFASHLEARPSRRSSVPFLFLGGLTLGLIGFGLYWFREPLLDLLGMGAGSPPPVAAPAPQPAAEVARPVVSEPPPAAEPEAQPPSAPAEPAPAPAEPPPAAAERAARRVERIQAAAGEGGTVVVIEGDSPFPRGAVSLSRLGGGSPRILVRLAGIRSLYRPASLSVGTPELKAVRVGLHGAGDGSSLHVVLDLAGAEVRAEETVDGATVRIRLLSR